MAIEAVPPGARVLDIGCGPGLVAAELVKKRCVVDGADQFPPVDAAVFDAFHVWREPDPLDVDVRHYDCVLLLDIIEHLTQPEAFLDRLRSSARSMGDRPRVVITTGNVAFFVVRLQALLGRFNYGKRGILDLTHTRLYTFKTLRRLFEQCGFRITHVEGIPAPFPLALGDTRLGRAATRVNDLLIRVSRGLFAYQVFMIAVPTPTVDALLDRSLTESSRKADALAEPDAAAAGRRR
jgi:SAM-dependent methyltransferase